MNTMGVDIGTSGCKAVVFDEHGHQLSSSYRGYSLIVPEPGAAELDPGLVIDLCMEVIREAALSAGAGSVAALGISSQGEAFTAVGGDGKSLCNAMVSSDVRSAPYAEKWPRSFGEERLYEITGHTAHPMFTLFKLLWLRDCRPGVWKEARRFLCFEDMLCMKLGLEPCMGWPLAGRTMLFDVRRHAWDDDILDAAGISADQLAAPLASGSRVGAIESGLAAGLGLAQGAFAVTGGHDQPCAALGSGAVAPGSAMYATGTVECITPTFSEAVFSGELRKGNLCTYDHTLPGRYATVAFSLTGGNILAWARDVFGKDLASRASESGRNIYELMLEEAGERPSPLMVLPYWTPSGTPYFDTKTPGAVVGWRMDTTRGQFFRALLEGVAFEMRLNLEILEKAGCSVNQLNAVGGGAKSRLWTQLKADVTGRPIRIMEVSEAGCLGTAMLARASLDKARVDELATRWVNCIDTAEPEPGMAGWYREKFAGYCELYKSMSAL